MSDTCECTEKNTGLSCPAQASWVVGVGNRVIDRQYACGRHLHQVCRAMIQADLPHHTTLTITPAGKWGKYCSASELDR